MSWWWLSFASRDTFLGVVIVEADDDAAAVARADALGIHPGGMVAAVQLKGPKEGFTDRLLSRAEVRVLQAEPS